MSADENNNLGESQNNTLSDATDAKPMSRAEKVKLRQAAKLKARKKKARQVLRKRIATLDEDIQTSLQAGRILSRDRALKEKRNKSLMIAGGLIVLGLLIYVAFMPRKAHVSYGICRTFIEMRVKYPDTLRFVSVQYMPKRTRVWYVQHDPFGHKAVDQMDCFFDYRYNPPLIRKAELNRREIDPRDIKRFNGGIASWISQLPQYFYPRGLPDDIKSLK